MGETIRGAGLLKADGMLATLAENPEQLENARRRFSMSLRSNCSSHNSTRSQSSDPASEREQHHDQRHWQVKKQYYASCPYRQFEAQKHEELDRLYTADNNWTTRQPPGVDFHQLAEDNVKRRWESQGIWNDNWEVTGEAWRWKHEESGPRTDAKATVGAALFRQPRERSRERQIQGTSDETQQQWCESERDASRPFNQFIHQVSEERKRIQSASGPGIVGSNPDIYTKAYEAVRKVWVRRGIWDTRWGMLPGMSWKHEESLDDILDAELGNEPDPPQAAASDFGSCELVGASSGRIHRPMGSSSNHEREPVGLDASSQTTAAEGMPHEAVSLFNPNVWHPWESQQQSLHPRSGSIRRHHDDSALSHERVLRPFRAERSSAVASDTSRAHRQKEPNRRRRRVSSSQKAAITASPLARRRNKHRQEARDRTADQPSGDNLPYATRLRPRTARGRVQQAQRGSI